MCAFHSSPESCQRFKQSIPLRRPHHGRFNLTRRPAASRRTPSALHSRPTEQNSYVTAPGLSERFTRIGRNHANFVPRRSGLACQLAGGVTASLARAAFQLRPSGPARSKFALLSCLDCHRENALPDVALQGCLGQFSLYVGTRGFTQLRGQMAQKIPERTRF